jgi:hypothetical protein
LKEAGSVLEKLLPAVGRNYMVHVLLDIRIGVVGELASMAVPAQAERIRYDVRLSGNH